VKATDLKIGDRIKIISVPGEGVPNYRIDEETVWAYKQIIARNRPVRISQIRAGLPSFSVRLKNDGVTEHHSFLVCEGDNNWEFVG
jgi:hypothetical protein